MRARSLKPSLFRNELLAVADPLHTLIFEGLWCVADRAGRLEDRPARLHLDINPGRPYDGTVQSLDWLAVHGFIHRYEVAGLRFIQVVNFSKHQNPHHREPPSTIPAPEKPEAISGCHPEKPRVDGSHPEKPRSSPSLAVLTPDSGLLTPDSCANAQRARPRRASRADELRPEPGWFVELRQVYPRRAGDQGWPAALEAAEQRIRGGCSPEQILSGARRYAEYVEATGAAGTQYVKSAAKFIVEGKFHDAWAVPPTRNQAKQDANVAASVAWLEQRQ